MTARQSLRWMPDEMSARILAAYRLRRESLPSVIRRALLLLATSDGILRSGRIVTERQQQRERRTP